MGRLIPRIGPAGSWTSTLATSGIIVGAWGYFLYQGVLDPLGGINSLWPLFGISNQILASVALVVATTILIKMGRRRYLWVTLVPTLWLVTVTLTGSWQKMFHEDPRVGFLAQARVLEQQIADRRVPEARLADTRRLIFNNRLDAAVTGFFALLILALIFEAGLEWYRILTGRRAPVLTETAYVRTKWAEGSP
jgi:carbon starvation protein